MGTGKSATGRRLAKRLGAEFVDMDQVIEKEAGMTISEIFDRFGEPYFRRLEKEAVCSLAGSDGKVIATGGGVVLDPENIQTLKKIGSVICLTATAETIYERVRYKSHRPLLQVADPVGRIMELLKERQPHYAMADYHIPTDGETVAEIVDKIVALINAGD